MRCDLKKHLCEKVQGTFQHVVSVNESGVEQFRVTFRMIVFCIDGVQAWDPVSCSQPVSRAGPGPVLAPA